MYTSTDACPFSESSFTLSLSLFLGIDYDNKQAKALSSHIAITKSNKCRLVLSRDGKRFASSPNAKI
jgi:hypothetical protein